MVKVVQLRRDRVQHTPPRFLHPPMHRLLGAFAVALRNGRFLPKSDGPLAEGTICGAISHVAQTFQDCGEQNLTKDEDSKLSCFLQRLFWGLQNSDWNVKQQKALPVCVLQELAKQDITNQDIALTQLAIGAFFFACR